MPKEIKFWSKLGDWLHCRAEKPVLGYRSIVICGTNAKLTMLSKNAIELDFMIEQIKELFVDNENEKLHQIKNILLK